MLGKKIVSLAVAGAVVSTALVAGTLTNVRADKKEQVQIEYWHSFSDVETKVLTSKIIPAFNKIYPNIKVKSTRMPSGDDYLRQITQGAMTGKTPDLARVDIVWVPELAKLGALNNVDSNSDFAALKKTLYKSCLSTCYYNHHYYGLPLDTNCKVAIYNKSLLAAAGLKQAPKTFDDLIKAAQKLKATGKKNVYGFGIGTGIGTWQLSPYYLSLGGKVTDDENSKATGYLNSKESVTALTKLVDLNDKGLVGKCLLGGLGTWEGMKGNNYMMIDEGPWFFPANQDFANKNVIVSTIPTGVGGSKSVVGGEDNVSFRTSKHPKETYEFAKFLASPTAQEMMVKELKIVPVNRTVGTSKLITSDPVMKVYMDQLDDAWARTPNPNWNKIDEALTTAFEKAIRHKATPKKALDDAAKQVDQLLK